MALGVVIFDGRLALIFNGQIESLADHSAGADQVVGRIRLWRESTDSHLRVKRAQAADQTDQAQANKRFFGK